MIVVVNGIIIYMYIPCKTCSRLIDSRAKHGQCRQCFVQSGGMIPKPETREKLRQIKLSNPTKYWLGKKRDSMVGHKWNVGKTAWNKGIPWSDEVREKFSKAHKGKHRSPDTEFKKGLVPAWKGVFGDSTHSAHNWIKHTVKDRDSCEKCGSKNNLEWSNKTHTYKKELSDWQYLCRKCHMKYDKETFNLRLHNSPNPKTYFLKNE